MQIAGKRSLKKEKKGKEMDIELAIGKEFGYSNNSCRFSGRKRK